MELTEVDPEVAALAFGRDLDRLWSTGRPDELGWKNTKLDGLTVIVEIPARTIGGARDAYHVRLHASHYGPHPAKVNFVDAETWEIAHEGSRWFPRLENLPPWFGLHNSYAFEDGSHHQLLCFSFNLDYYISNHTCQPTEAWQQSTHTVAATLNRLHEILGPAYYRGPSAPLAQAA